MPITEIDSIIHATPPYWLAEQPTGPQDRLVTASATEIYPGRTAAINVIDSETGVCYQLMAESGVNIGSAVVV